MMLAGLLPGEQPWLGYFFIMEDGDKSRSSVRIEKGAFPVEPVWHDSSYQDRAAIFCERLKAEKLYEAVCYITSSPDDPKPREPVESLDWQRFSAAIHARITYLKDLGLPGETDMLPTVP
jgi:hypothetical protein